MDWNIRREGVEVTQLRRDFLSAYGSYQFTQRTKKRFSSMDFFLVPLTYANTVSKEIVEHMPVRLMKA